MSGVKVTISPKLQALPYNLRQGLIAGRERQRTFAIAAVKLSIRNVNAIASRKLFASVDGTTSDDLTSIRVGPKAAQGYWIEYGRKPGSMPRWAVFRDILRAWATAKGLNIDDGGLYAIARKIRELGWPARRPVQKARNMMAGQLKVILARAIGDKLR